jgi:hypothetical protein
LDVGIGKLTTHALLGVEPGPPPEEDVRINPMPAATATPAAMIMMALRFIPSDRHRSLFFCIV